MKLYGLIGYPLGHSFSKKYFTEKFEKEQLKDCFFELFEIPEILEFEKLVINNPRLLGLGVTIPYKEQVLKYVHELSPEVAEIRATNSIKIQGKKLIAYNTDIIGFEQSFVKKLQHFHKKALVLGTGGASKAVQFVLSKLNIPFLIVSRNQTPTVGHISYADLNESVISEHPIIINCTPVGMFPNIDTAPHIPYLYLTHRNYLYDLVYKPAKTLFLQRGEIAGATVENGYDMLIIQAEASWKIWNEI